VEPKRIVESGYDAIADTHLDWLRRIDGDPRMRFVEELLDRLPEPVPIVDLGCGAGVPCTAALAERHDVLGVDVSAAQLDLARDLVPRARFEKHDMTEVDLPAGSVGAVTAFYSVGHVPRDEHAALYARIATWLRPGGLFLAGLACTGNDGVAEDWLGAPMYFSSHEPATNRALLREAGFTLLVDELVTMREPEREATFHWVLARS